MSLRSRNACGGQATANKRDLGVMVVHGSLTERGSLILGTFLQVFKSEATRQAKSFFAK